MCPHKKMDKELAKRDSWVILKVELLDWSDVVSCLPWRMVFGHILSNIMIKNVFAITKCVFLKSRNDTKLGRIAYTEYSKSMWQ